MPDEFEILETNKINQPESLGAYAGRTGARTLARSAESIVGLPGDIANSLLGLTNYGIKKATGAESPLPQQIPILPTSQGIREKFTKPLTGKYLEPQSSGESFYDDIISDAATLLIPTKGKIPFKKAVLGALGRSTVGNTAQWATEEVTGSKLGGITAKIGSMALAGTVGGRKKLNEIKNNSYSEAFLNLPEKAIVNSKNLVNDVKKINQSIKKAHPDKNFIQGILNDINPIIKNGKSNVADLITTKQNLNKHLLNKLTPESKKITKNLVGKINETIEDYGKKNTNFYKPYKVGEELTTAMNSSNYVQDILSQSPLIQKSVKNPIVQHLLIGSAVQGLRYLNFPKLAALGTGAGIMHEGARAYQLLSKSSVARNAYKDLVQATLKNDTKAMAKHLSKLNSAADNFDKKYPSRNPDDDNLFEIIE